MSVSRRRLLGGLLGGGVALGAAQLAAASSAQAIPQSLKSGNYRLVRNDDGKALDFTGSTTARLFVPTDGIAPPVGAVVEAAQLGVAQLRIVADSGVTLLTPSGMSARARYSVLSLRHTSANTWLIAGDTA